MDIKPEHYQYDALPEDSPHIRLLHIQSVSSITISCSLSCHLLSDISDKFNTLSYVWGSDDFTSQILCNGKSLNITPSLERTLRQLFTCQNNPEEEEEEEEEEETNLRPCIEDYLWIDAICLNQSDPSEIASQIPLMGKIYSESRLTFAYLGDSDAGSDLALDLMPAIKAVLQAARNAKWGTIFISIILEQLNLPWSHEVWEQLGKIGQRAWCKRVWTLQEAIVAKKLIFGCGDRWVEGRDFFSTFRDIANLCLIDMLQETHLWPENHSLTFDQQPPGNPILGPIALCDSAEEYIGTEEVRGLITLVGFTRQRECKEPIDYIWGILGLIGPKLRQRIKNCGLIDNSPTGKSEYWNTYKQFTKFCLSNDPTLSILQQVPSERRPLGLPTWCPNWTAASPYNSSWLKSYHTGGDSTSVSPLFSGVKTSWDSDELRLSGFRLDRIRRVADEKPHWKGVDLQTETERILEWEDACLDICREAYGNFDAVPEAFWQTLVAGRISDGKPDTPVEEGLYHDTRFCLEVFRRPDTVDSLSEAETEKFRSAFGGFNKYFDATGICNSGRRYVSTHGGRIGMVAGGVEVEDVVCVFYGAGPLFLLRFGDDGRARFVGDGYVHGFMQKGESFASPDRGVDEEFILI